MAHSSFSSVSIAFATLLLIVQLGGCAQPGPAAPDGPTTSRSYETTGVPADAAQDPAGNPSRVTEGIQVDVTGLGAMILQ